MIALGTLVCFHHRAAVARYDGIHSAFSATQGWRLTEGVGRNLTKMPEWVAYEHLFERFPEMKHRQATINKTVMVWPEDGSGVVIGRVRRMRGTSYRGSGGEDSDPGYFEATEAFMLYAVRHSLDGLDYIFVPEWALTPAVS